MTLWRKLALVVLIVSPVDAVKADDALRQGYEFYEEGDFAAAEKSFRESNDPAAALGLGAVLYRREQFDEALKVFRSGEEKAADPQSKSLLRYNAGNALTQMKRYEEAVSEYKEALKHDSKNRDAQINHDYVQRLIPPPPKSPKPQSGEGKSGQAPQDQEQSDQQDSDGEPKNSEPQKDEGKGEQKEQPTPSPSTSTESDHQEPKSADDQSASNLLDSVQESYDGLRRYRRNVARAEQRRSQQLQSEYDW